MPDPEFKIVHPPFADLWPSGVSPATVSRFAACRELARLEIINYQDFEFSPFCAELTPVCASKFLLVTDKLTSNPWQKNVSGLIEDARWWVATVLKDATARDMARTLSVLDGNGRDPEIEVGLAEARALREQLYASYPDQEGLKSEELRITEVIKEILRLNPDLLNLHFYDGNHIEVLGKTTRVDFADPHTILRMLFADRPAHRDLAALVTILEDYRCDKIRVHSTLEYIYQRATSLPPIYGFDIDRGDESDESDLGTLQDPRFRVACYRDLFRAVRSARTLNLDATEDTLRSPTKTYSADWVANLFCAAALVTQVAVSKTELAMQVVDGLTVYVSLHTPEFIGAVNRHLKQYALPKEVIERFDAKFATLLR